MKPKVKALTVSKVADFESPMEMKMDVRNGIKEGSTRDEKLDKKVLSPAQKMRAKLVKKGMLKA